MPDVFICHATEDKETVAHPLAEALQRNGLEVWYDEFSLTAGDSLRESVDNGIKNSKYGVVIFSKSFFEKEWTRKELDAFYAREITSKKKVIIPIWHGLSFVDMIELAPTLANRFAIKTSDGMEQMVNQIIKVVKPELLKIKPERHVQPLINIFANKDSFLVGKSIIFSGKCINGGRIVHLIAIGPGDYSKGKEIASPVILPSGEWEFKWTPENSIEPGDYFVKASDSMNRVSDELLIRIEKGAITMVTAGDQVHYIGEQIKLSGTATLPVKKIFLSIRKDGLSTKQRKIDQLNIISQDDDSESFTSVEIIDDNTWSYSWDTSSVASDLKKGYYTIYATESPLTIGNMKKTAFSNVAINIEQPFVSATTSKSFVAQEDTLFFTGVAEGKPRKGLQIWIFGDNFFLLKKASVNPDASYTLRLTHDDSKVMAVGEYFAIVQHPMMNNEFDVYIDESNKKILSNYPKRGTELFSVEDLLKKKGIDAAIAIREALNNPNIDDTYTISTFNVEKPKIQFNNVEDKHVGEEITIAARTNLTVDTEVIFEFSYKNSNSTERFPLIVPVLIRIIKVIKGERGWNLLSFNVDTKSFIPGKYLISASALNGIVTEPLYFNLIK